MCMVWDLRYVYVCALCALCNKFVHDIYEGTHSKALSKMIYLESRRFFPSSSDQTKEIFPQKIKNCSLRQSHAEVKASHDAYKQVLRIVKLCPWYLLIFHDAGSKAGSIAQATGYKERYALDFHDPVCQTVPDAMHTVKVVMEHLLYLIVGKEDSIKVREAEIELKRFNLACTSAPFAPASKKRKNELGFAPFRINKDKIKLADQYACSIICPLHT